MNNTMKYYPARSLGVYPTVPDALRSRGYTQDQVDFLIRNAEISRSESEFVPCDKDIGFVAVKLANGSAILWEACVAALFDTQTEAAQFAMAVDAQLVQLGKPKGDWAIFEYRKPKSGSLN